MQELREGQCALMMGPEAFTCVMHVWHGSDISTVHYRHTLTCLQSVPKEKHWFVSAHSVIPLDLRYFSDVIVFPDYREQTEKKKSQGIIKCNSHEQMYLCILVQHWSFCPLATHLFGWQPSWSTMTKPVSVLWSQREDESATCNAVQSIWHICAWSAYPPFSLNLSEISLFRISDKTAACLCWLQPAVFSLSFLLHDTHLAANHWTYTAPIWWFNSQLPAERACAQLSDKEQRISPRLRQA